MAGKQQFQEPEEAEAALKRAVELYHRDRTKQDAVEAALGALSEMDIPADYFEAAQREREQQLEQKKERDRQRQIAFEQATTAVQPKTISEAIARLIHDWGFFLLLGIGFFLFTVVPPLISHSSESGSVQSSDTQAETPDGSPQKWDIAANRSDFLLDTNPQTDADMVKVTEGANTFERIRVRSFGRDPKVSNDASSVAYYAKAHLNDQTIFFRGLRQLKFKARSKGISSLYVGFTDADNSATRFSVNLDLKPQWKEYTVDLDKLRWLDQDGNWPETGHPPDKGGLYFFTGEGANDLNESGHVDFEDVELTD